MEPLERLKPGDKVVVHSINGAKQPGTRTVLRLTKDHVITENSLGWESKWRLSDGSCLDSNASSFYCRPEKKDER